jgi:ABC-type sugar transport system substrate-binding protein
MLNTLSRLPRHTPKEEKRREDMVRRLASTRRTAVLAVSVAAVLALVLAGCGSSSSSTTTGSTTKTTTTSGAGSTAEPTVYMIGSVTNNTFWAAVQRGFLAGGKAFGVHAIYEAPGIHASSSSIPLIQSALAAHPAGMAINYSDASIRAPTLAALDQGVAVTLFNNNRFEEVGGKADTATTDPRITTLPYVGEDSLLNAEDLAKTFIPYLKKKGTILIVDPVPGVEVLALRRQGIETVMHANGFSTAYLPAGLDEGTNLTTIGSYLQAHSNVVGVVGLGDPTGDPACTYIQKSNLSIPVATFDVDAEAIQHIQKGCMKAATDQQPYLQGYLSAANLAFQIVDHLYPVSVNTGSYIVTSQNVAEVAKAVAAGKG